MRLARRSAALTGVIRDGDAVNASVQEKTVLDDPVPEMATCRTNIFLLCCYSIVYLQYSNTHTHSDILSEIPLLYYYPAEYSCTN